MVAFRTLDGYYETVSTRDEYYDMEKRWRVECIEDIDASLVQFNSAEFRVGPLPFPFWEVQCGCAGSCKGEFRVCRTEEAAHSLAVAARISGKCLNDVAQTHCKSLFCDTDTFDACGVIWPQEPLNGRADTWRSDTRIAVAGVAPFRYERRLVETEA